MVVCEDASLAPLIQARKTVLFIVMCGGQAPAGGGGVADVSCP